MGGRQLFRIGLVGVRVEGAMEGVDEGAADGDEEGDEKVASTCWGRAGVVGRPGRGVAPEETVPSVAEDSREARSSRGEG